MRVKFECPITFIESEISRVFSVDNKNPECIILNPGPIIQLGEMSTEYLDLSL